MSSYARSEFIVSNSCRNIGIPVIDFVLSQCILFCDLKRKFLHEIDPTPSWFLAILNGLNRVFTKTWKDSKVWKIAKMSKENFSTENLRRIERRQKRVAEPVSNNNAHVSRQTPSQFSGFFGNCLLRAQ
jgi:hypothetical protein